MNLLVLLCVILPSEAPVEVTAFHQYENVYFLICNHGNLDVESVRVSIRSTTYRGEHEIWTWLDPPIQSGKNKVVVLKVQELELLPNDAYSGLEIRIVSVNEFRIVNQELAPPNWSVDQLKRIPVYVDAVLDGDTVNVHGKSGKKFTVRLHGIDAPESFQPFGLEATNLLKQLTVGKPLQLQVRDKNRSGQLVGVLQTAEGESINLKMLQQGMARHFWTYDKSEAFVRAEDVAKVARVGIWSSANRNSPQDYRNGVKVRTVSPVNAPSNRTSDETVYITEYGSKYHRSGCQHLSRSKQPTSLKDAKGLYEPCLDCNPPR